MQRTQFRTGLKLRPQYFGPYEVTTNTIVMKYRKLDNMKWVPSHVDLLGNEVADYLAKAATSNPVDSEDHMVLTSTEIYSRAKELICRTWEDPFLNTHGTFKDILDPPYHSRVPDHIKRHSHDFLPVT
ncbi:RNase H domain-containing protein [Trichonephila clavipes]|uniref:RNase H domain-containing protein n=1 Tax=Trichonephila clavipes TaxID=2585209 RepID=A0A8X7BJP9_TRICX|nr:RNase H domain-containing protein [Trichonephila clavipes]